MATESGPRAVFNHRRIDTGRVRVGGFWFVIDVCEECKNYAHGWSDDEAQAELNARLYLQDIPCLRELLLATGAIVRDRLID